MIGDLYFREQLASVSQWIVEELDRAYAAISSIWGIEHTVDGGHGNITAGTGRFTGDLSLFHDSALDGAGYGVKGYTNANGSSGTQTNIAAMYLLQQTTGAKQGYVAFYTANGSVPAERVRIDRNGSLSIGETANAYGTVCLTVNQGANDDEALALKSSDVTHGVTDLTSTNTFASLRKVVGADGGLLTEGFTDATRALVLSGVAVTEDTTKSVAGAGAVEILASTKSGSSIAAPGANANMLAVRTRTGTTRFILDADGDSHQDVGTTWTNFDDHDDIALLDALSAGVSPAHDPLRLAFAELLEQHQDTLAKHRIVTFNDDGHHFINWSRAHMLMIGAVRQLAQRCQRLERQLLEQGGKDTKDDGDTV